jgi:hypothetical protein
MSILTPIPGIACLFLYLRGCARDWRVAALSTALVCRV